MSDKKEIKFDDSQPPTGYKMVSFTSPTGAVQTYLYPDGSKTDKQKLEALLESFGVEYEASEDVSGLLVVKCCFTSFYFDKDGKFAGAEGDLG